MSEGVHLTSNLASLTLRLSDPATARFSLLRPGRRVPTRETAPTPGDSAKDCLTGLRRSRGSHKISGSMKTNLHPEYHEVLVHCACGETWTTRSTKKELRIEICSKCHPFFTGKQKLVDSAGRVERFRKRYEKKAAGASS